MLYSEPPDTRHVNGSPFENRCKDFTRCNCLIPRYSSSVTRFSIVTGLVSVICALLGQGAAGTTERGKTCAHVE
jgi:hypothetical protein